MENNSTHPQDNVQQPTDINNTQSPEISENPTPPPDKPDSLLKNKKTLIIAGASVFVLIVILLFARLLILPSNNSASETTLSEKETTTTPTETLSTISPSIPQANRISPTQSVKTNQTPTPTQIKTTQPPTSTLAPTTAPFSIQSVDPGYLPENYSSNDKMKITGSGFKTGATAIIQGPYDLSTGQPVGGYNDYPLQRVIVTSGNYIDGTIGPGLPPGYFKVIVRNPDGSTASTGFTLLHQGYSSGY